ncbi:hypothetical protein [Candidatus Poriferisocius sp.]|uniref:hypothetical protein n=1 Tax=Candidatus Poriferisocius sp. TaxID=3101276 RepID=UPI003B017B7D
MNVDAIRRTIDSIKAAPDTYCQSIWAWTKDPHGCGTPACVAGHAVAGNGHEIVKAPFSTAVTARLNGKKMPIHDAAAEVLGLDLQQSLDLFAAHPYLIIDSHQCIFTPTAADAIETLERLIETGEVTWVRQSRRHPEADA